MLSHKIKSLPKLQSSSIIVLIVAFLWLSYCPLRKTIQDFITGTHHTEQTNAGITLKPVSLICLDIADRKIIKLANPQTEFIALPALLVITLILFLPFRGFYNEYVFCHQPPLHSVPIYLTNRVLLI